VAVWRAIVLQSITAVVRVVRVLEELGGQNVREVVLVDALTGRAAAGLGCLGLGDALALRGLVPEAGISLLTLAFLGGCESGEEGKGGRWLC